ncbi:sensor histidine kinase [Microbacterium keratanolyticum]
MSTATPRTRWGFAAAGSVALYIVGVLLDVCGIVNVPQAVEFTADDGGSVSIVGIGTGLVMLVLVLWVSVFWLHRQPLVALLAGALVALIGTSYLLFLIGAVAYVRRYRDRQRPVALIVVTTVALYVLREALTTWGGAVAWFTSRADADANPAWILVSVVTAIISVGAAAVIVLTSRARQQVRQSDARAFQEHQRADALTVEVARQAERERIARDMHDALAHRLSVLSLHAGALETAPSDSAQVGEIARTVREQSHAALQDMRGLIGDLRSEPVQSTPPTMRAVWALVANLRASGVPISAYVVFDSPSRASTQLESAVYRIVQEALTNAIKHSPRSTIDVFVQAEPTEGVRIRIVNPLPVDAKGSAVPGGGNGLIGVRERAAALDGTAWIGAHESTFIVDVTLPWQESELLRR